MVKKSALIFFICCVTLSLGCTQKSDHTPTLQATTITAPTTAMPALHMQPELFKLGDIKEGEAAIATFLLRNNNNEAIEIIDIQASCGCTVAEPDSYIVAPGGFTQIKVAVDSTAKQDNIRKTIFITDSLGNKASATLSFNVVENPHLNIQTGQKGIFDGQCGSCHFEPLQMKVKGAEIYAVGCAMCHGEQADGAYAPVLNAFEDASTLTRIINEGVGKPQMPGFAKAHGGPLNPTQVEALTRWLMSLSEIGKDKP